MPGQSSSEIFIPAILRGADPPLPKLDRHAGAVSLVMFDDCFGSRGRPDKPRAAGAASRHAAVILKSWLGERLAVGAPGSCPGDHRGNFRCTTFSSTAWLSATIGPSLIGSRGTEWRSSVTAAISDWKPRMIISAESTTVPVGAAWT